MKNRSLKKKSLRKNKQVNKMNGGAPSPSDDYELVPKISADDLLKKLRTPHARRRAPTKLFTMLPDNEELVGNKYSEIMMTKHNLDPIPYIAQQGAACPIISVIQGIVACAILYNKPGIIDLIRYYSERKLSVPSDIEMAMEKEVDVNPYDYDSLSSGKGRSLLAKRTGITGNPPDYPTPPISASWLASLLKLDCDQVYSHLGDSLSHEDVMYTFETGTFSKCHIIIMNELPFTKDGELDLVKGARIGIEFGLPNHVISLVALPNIPGELEYLLYLDTNNYKTTGNLILKSKFLEFVKSNQYYAGAMRCLPLSIIPQDEIDMLASHFAQLGGKNKASKKTNKLKNKK